MRSFGTPQMAMLLPLDGRKKLVNADLEKVKQALSEQGYYLQLPPPSENLLKKHLAEQETIRLTHEENNVPTS